MLVKMEEDNFKKIFEKEKLADYSLFIYSFSKDMIPKDKVKFIREFFGYKLSKNNRRYSYGGLLSKFGGNKISNNIFIAPKKNSQVIEAYLESRGVDFVVKE
jgi:hypothetical protein